MKIFGHTNDLKLKSLNYKVVDLVEYYNFDIKFVFVRPHTRNLWSFLAAYHCWFKPRTDSDSISVGFWLKPTVTTQYHYRFLAKTDSDMNRQWRPEYQCRLILSLPVLTKNRQWWTVMGYHCRFLKIRRWYSRQWCHLAGIMVGC